MSRRAGRGSNKIRASIDWCTVFVVLPVASNKQIIERIIPAFARPFSPLQNLNANTTEVLLTFQNPPSRAYIRRHLALIGALQPRCVAAELSQDSVNKLPFEYLAYLFRGIQTGLNNPRFANTQIQPYPRTFSEVIQLFKTATAYFGDESSGHLQRLYFKTTDNGHDLPADQHVARFENTFFAAPGQSLPGILEGSLSDLFTPACFKVRKLKATGNKVTDQLIQPRITRIAPQGRHLTAKGRRQHCLASSADTQLTKDLNRALALLDASWTAEPPPAPALTGIIFSVEERVGRADFGPISGPFPDSQTPRNETVSPMSPAESESQAEGGVTITVHGITPPDTTTGTAAAPKAEAGPLAFIHPINHNTPAGRSPQGEGRPQVINHPTTHHPARSRSPPPRSAPATGFIKKTNTLEKKPFA